MSHCRHPLHQHSANVYIYVLLFMLRLLLQFKQQQQQQRQQQHQETAAATKTVVFESPDLEGGAVPVGHLQLWGISRRGLQCFDVFADILLHH